jgi:competence protein ComEC
VFLGLIFIKIINFVSEFNILLFLGSPSIVFISIYYLILAVYFGYIKLNLDFKLKKIILLSALFLLFFSLKLPDHLLKIHYINVGQGESIFIETPNKKGIVIDTGPALENFSALKKRVIPYFQRLGYKDLSMVLFTHFHNDHAGDYQYLLDHYKVGKVFCYESPKNTNYKFIHVSKGDKITIDGIKINVLYPDPTKVVDSSDKNEECLVIELIYKNFSMLVPGDVEAKVLDEISESESGNGNENEGYDVFNVSHHGSIKSFSTKMVDNTKIGLAIISVGKNNFGHPSRQVLDYLNSKNICTYRTDKQGSITITTDGNKYQTIFQ